MTYNNLFNDFCTLFAEDKKAIQSIKENLCISDDDGSHVLFGMVVTPFVLEMVKVKNTNKIRKAFEFFEEMAKSNSVDICEVLEFSVLENIISSDMLTECKEYMLLETKKSCEELEQWSV